MLCQKYVLMLVQTLNYKNSYCYVIKNISFEGVYIMEFPKLEWMSTNLEGVLEALEKLTAETVISQVALQAARERVRLTVVENLVNTKLFVDVTKNVRDVRLAAVERLTDQRASLLVLVCM